MIIADTVFNNVPNWVLLCAGTLSTVLWGFLWYRADERYVNKSSYDKDVEEHGKRQQARESDYSHDMDVIHQRINALESTMRQDSEKVRKSVHDLRESLMPTLARLGEGFAEMKGAFNERNKIEDLIKKIAGKTT